MFASKVSRRERVNKHLWPKSDGGFIRLLYTLEVFLSIRYHGGLKNDDIEQSALFYNYNFCFC